MDHRNFWPRVVRLILSALSAGGIAFGTGITTVLTAKAEVTEGVLWLCWAAAGIAVCKDIQASLSSAPQTAQEGSREPSPPSKVIAPALLLGCLLALPGAVYGQTGTCTRWASPNGSGDGLSTNSPYQIINFLNNDAAPGAVLCLKPGEYTGQNSMIQPNPGTSGNSNPGGTITIRAESEATMADIPFINARYGADGQARWGFYLDNNSYWVFEGFDVGNGVEVVMRSEDNTHHLTFRRMCFFNANVVPRQQGPGEKAPIGNTHNMNPGGSNLLFEDICAVGWGRNSYVDGNGQGNVIRRLFARWEGGRDDVDFANSGGPEYQLDYSVGRSFGHDTLYLNMIGVYSAEKIGSFGGVVNNLGWSTRTGLASTGGNQSHQGNLFAGHILYALPSSSVLPGNNAPDGTWVRNFWMPNRIKDIFVDARQHSNSVPFSLACDRYLCECGQPGCDPCIGAPDCSRAPVDRITAWTNPGGAANDITAAGSRTNIRTCTGGIENCPNFYTGTGGPGAGSRACFEVDDSGNPTSTKLWPWRMDDRIKQAIQRAGSNPLSGGPGVGYASNTVTSEIASRYGAPPPECNRAGTPPVGGNPSIWLTFEECVGNIANDEMRNGNSGTLLSTGGPVPMWVQARLGRCGLHFAGTGDYVRVDSGNVATNFTVAFTINGDDAITGANATTPLYMEYASPGGKFGFNWDDTQVAFRQSFIISPDFSTFVPCKLTTTLSASTWYRLLATYDGSTLRCYLNGTLETSVAVNPPLGTLTNFWIAPAPGLVYSNAWRGTIDEFILESRQWNQTEITSDFNRNFNPTPGGAAPMTRPFYLNR